MIRLSILLPCLVCLLFAQACARTQTPTDTFHVGEMIQHTFTPVDPIAEPFLTPVWVTIGVEDRSKAGRNFAVPAFFDGDNTWRIRYTPLHAGTYHIDEYLIGDDSESASQVSVNPESPSEYVVVDAPFRAFPRPSPDRVQQFVYNDGTPYFPIGHDLGWFSVEEYRDAFKKMSDAGLNWSRLWMPHWSGQSLDWVMGKEMPPGELDLEVARRWDQIVDAAEENHIQFQLVLQHHGQFSTTTNPNWSDHPWYVESGGWLEKPSDFFTDEKAKRLTKARYRYIVARWGHSPSIMAWELFNEVEFTDGYLGEELIDIWRRMDDPTKPSAKDLASVKETVENLTADNSTDGPTPLARLIHAYTRKTQYLPVLMDYGLGRFTVAEWHSEMAAYLRGIDINPRMITTSSVPPDSPIWDDMDYYQIHAYEREMINPMLHLPGGLEAYDKPVFIAEMGDHAILDKNKEDGRYMHAMMWAGLFSGAAGAAQVWAWDKITERNEYPTFRAMVDFAHDAKLGIRAYTPDSVSFQPEKGTTLDSTVKGAALSSEDALIFWLYDQKTVNDPHPASHQGDVIIPEKFANAGRLSVTWWLTRKEERLEPVKITPDSDRLLSTPEFDGDIAAIIEIIEKDHNDGT